MRGWRGHALRAAIALAVIAGGYLCTIGAYDHRRPPPARADRAPVLADAAEASSATCVREGAGVTCTEEILVVAPRRARPPVLISQREQEPRKPAAR